MTGDSERSRSHILLQAAAEFWERRRFGSWNAADEAELTAWLDESTLHRVAYLRIEAIAARADAVAFARRPLGDGLVPKARRRFDLRRRPGRFVIPLLSIAAAFLLVELGTPFVMSWFAPSPRSVATDIGGRSLVRFADGTEFELNTDSAVHYLMTNRERTVWVDRGEVWFHVAHNPRLPFAAVVGNHRVTDLGTEFDVRRGADQIEVALINGKADLGITGTQTVALTPGDDAVATASAIKVTHRTSQALVEKLAWRKGTLVFRNERLGDVVRELNRYNTTRLVVTDPVIADERITTNLRADDLERFVTLTEAVLNLRVDRKGNEILFSRDTRRGRLRN